MNASKSRRCETNSDKCEVSKLWISFGPSKDADVGDAISISLLESKFVTSANGPRAWTFDSPAKELDEEIRFVDVVRADPKDMEHSLVCCYPLRKTIKAS
jgi:hypothetical protein